MFTPAQLTQIKQATLSRIICDNSDAIDKVPHDVFTITSFPEGYTKCNSPVLSKVDIKIWTHCCHGKDILYIIYHDTIWEELSFCCSAQLYHLTRCKFIAGPAFIFTPQCGLVA